MSVSSLKFVGLAALLAALTVPAHAAGNIAGKLSFSVDGGVTYSPQAPGLDGAREVLVKVDFALEGEDRAVEGNIVTTNLRSEEADFASANLAKQSWAGKPGWYQRIPTSWFDARRPQTAIYPLDLRARPYGAMGTANKWDGTRGAFVAAPLPAIPARGAGKHNFTFRLSYRVAGVADPVFLDMPFQITIGAGAAEAPKIPAGSPTTPPDEQALPVLTGLKVWPAEQWQIVDGTGKVAPVPPLVRTRLGQEAALRLTDVAVGDYHLRALVESGSGNGEDEFQKDLPFLYLNGRPVDFARSTAVVPFGTTNVSIIETRVPIRIQPGDQLRWNSVKRAGRLFGAVSVTKEPLTSAPVELKPFYDPDLQDVFRLKGSFKLDEQNEFSLEVRNFSGAPGDFQVHAEVRDYWQKVVATKDEKLSLTDFAKGNLALAFPNGDTDRYRAIVRVTGPGGVECERVYDQLVDNPRGARPRLWLNDGWEWTSLADNGTMERRVIGDTTFVAGLGNWQKVNLPASWQDFKTGEHVAYYRRQFTVPEAMTGRRLFLHLTRVAYEGRVFLNGKELGLHLAQNGPFEYEITGAVRPGANDLLIGARDGIAALEPDEVKAGRLEVSARARLRAPLPLKVGVGEVWLYGAEQQVISDVFVQPSWRQKNLRVDLQLPQIAGATVSNRVFFEGREVLRFADAPVTASSLTVTQAWADPILWNPGDPKLLQLVTELKAANGTVLDRVDTRFGFREFWPEGKDLMWNGRPMKFAAIPFLSSWSYNITDRGKRDTIREYLLLTKRMGANMQRHIYDPEYRAEMNDEEGIVMAQSFGGISNPTQQMVDSDEFWKHAAEFQAEAIRGQRNSPAIVTWYLSNEFWGAHEPANQRRLQELGKALAPLDPTRIQEFGCDLDVGGYTSIVSTHYPVDVRALRQENGVMPEAAYWHRFGEPLKPGDKAPAGIVKNVANVRADSPITWGTKPLVINETLWNFFFQPPDGLSRLAGDEVYTGPVAGERWYKEANSWFIRGHRDAEASVITPWEFLARNPINLELPPVDINPVQRYAHFYAGQDVPFDVNLHCDRASGGQFDFTWTLTLDGKVVKRETKPYSFGSGEMKRVAVAFKAPDVKTRSAGTLTFELTENGTSVRRLEIPVDVWPRQIVVWSAGLKLGLFDPEGTTAKALAAFSGPAPAKVAALDEPSLRGLNVLIIGTDAAVPESASARQALRQFLDNGGRVLVLAQSKTPGSLPVRLATTGLVANKLFSFRPDSPLLQGTTVDDWADWYPTQRTGSGFYLKPSDGGWQTVLESGGPGGLVYAGLLQTSVGNGILVCSQLDLTSNLDSNPIAAKLWSNLLAYLARPVSAAAKVGSWVVDKGDLAGSIDRLGAKTTAVNAANLQGLNGLVLDANAKLSAADSEALAQFVRNGGRLLIHGITPDNKMVASQILGAPVKTFAPSPRAWNGRAVRLTSGGAIAGISNYDLFWKRRPDTEDYAASYVNDSGTLANLGNWALEVPGAKPLLYPTYLLEAPLGRGSVILDTLNWDKVDPLTKTHAKRIGMALLSNLGTRFETPRPLAIPENLTYQPVDLSTVLNRPFADDAANNGQGGWTDQGPEKDLRDFPKDPVQTFLGVPVRIEKDKGALIMSSQFLKPGLPRAVELPVTGRADALFFLQTSAWTSKAQHGSYIVHYADGSRYEVQLSGETNLRDWAANNAGDPFSLETDTITRVAWTGKTAALPSVNLYLMTWPNPHPEKEIRGVTFTSTNVGVPILVAVTVGVKQTGGVVATTGDAAAAAKLVDEGRALRKAGKLDEAGAKFEAARRADARNEAAYLELAGVRESQKRWADAITVYNALLAVSPEQLEGLIRLGKAYEEMGRWEDADKTYRHSLDVNRNQPEILKAIADLKARRK